MKKTLCAIVAASSFLGGCAYNNPQVRVDFYNHCSSYAVKIYNDRNGKWDYIKRGKVPCKYAKHKKELEEMPPPPPDIEIPDIPLPEDMPK